MKFINLIKIAMVLGFSSASLSSWAAGVDESIAAPEGAAHRAVLKAVTFTPSSDLKEPGSFKFKLSIGFFPENQDGSMALGSGGPGNLEKEIILQEGEGSFLLEKGFEHPYGNLMVDMTLTQGDGTLIESIDVRKKQDQKIQLNFLIAKGEKEGSFTLSLLGPTYTN